jgi:hypothetical protein
LRTIFTKEKESEAKPEPHRFASLDLKELHQNDAAPHSVFGDRFRREYRVVFFVVQVLSSLFFITVCKKFMRLVSVSSELIMSLYVRSYMVRIVQYRRSGIGEIILTKLRNLPSSFRENKIADFANYNFKN